MRPEVTYFGNMVVKKKTRQPRPFKIEHRAVDPKLVAECADWGEWQLYAGYVSEWQREKALAQLQKAASGRWEYRCRDGEIV